LTIVKDFDARYSILDTRCLMLDASPKGFALRSKMLDTRGNDDRGEAVIVGNRGVFRLIVRKD